LHSRLPLQHDGAGIADQHRREPVVTADNMRAYPIVKSARLTTRKRRRNRSWR
jgi:hypothetical protein